MPRIRLSDLAERVSRPLQKPARHPSEVARAARRIVLNDVQRLMNYNLRAAHEHLYDLERRVRLAQQASSVGELLRVQVQRVPESGMRVSADVMRNIDIVRQTRRQLTRLLRTELRKQMRMERELPQLALPRPKRYTPRPADTDLSLRSEVRS